MTSCGHPIQDPPRGHGQNPVGSRSQPQCFTLNGMGHRNPIPIQKRPDLGPVGSSDVGHPGTLDLKSPPPVQLHLMGKRPPAIVPYFRPQGLQDRPGRIPESRPEPADPGRVDSSTVRTPPPFHPEGLDVLEVAGDIAVSPQPAAAPGTPPRPRPRVPLPLFPQPLYIDPNMEYQYSAVGRMAGEDMSATCPGHPSLFLSKQSAIDHPLYKRS